MTDETKPDANTLKNAFRVMHKEVRRMEEGARRVIKAGFIRGPRQFCGICGNVWDLAMVDPKAMMTKSLCEKCKKELRDGFTACITSNEYAFIKSPHLTEHGMSGKIVPMTDEAFKALKDKFDVSRPSN